MRPFKYSTTNDINVAVKMLQVKGHAKLLGGGTNILDLMKEDVEHPEELIDITGLSYTQIKSISSGPNAEGISIGALCKNTDTANDPIIRQNFPLVAQAILAGASAQIRNMATNGGNLNQRTRCSYFYDIAMPCNKREPGAGCAAIEGINKMHAIFGWSKDCVAVHPSDLCVALVALDAIVKVMGAGGKERLIQFSDYHRLPGTDPQKDNNLQQEEIITEIQLPKNNFASKSYYLKVRDRSSYAFALVSVAAAIEMAGNQIKQVRIAMGGVSHKPWRAYEAEQFLINKTPDEANFNLAAELEMRNAKPLKHNKFKVELGIRTMVRALTQAMNGGKHT
ncbi:xanthine dehydrogenase family protein subunit M [Pedobacter frigidisoli]|uniref:Xanthine dehydrogenase family protein subunit M n=1 Tax=Pedobacter frigidisoli TaxID=2530455 RepID=A0A4R0NCQ7_9SPHI|nr:xanthine dehydrogenase family protein subunit M [Pedobacter frigidisoli]TCC98129.1 xanthine dehydrogenase family protein subunit M [Pedobacter frigidisoli]